MQAAVAITLNEPPLWVEPCGSIAVARMAALGAERKLVATCVASGFAPKQPFAGRMRLCADSYLRDLAVDQVSANGRIRRCAGATCEIACFGFWPTSRCCADPVRASARRPERRRRIASPRGRAPLRRLSRSLRVTRPRSNVRLIVHGTPLVRKSSACEVSQSTVVRGTVKLRQPILSSA